MNGCHVILIFHVVRDSGHVFTSVQWVMLLTREVPPPVSDLHRGNSFY